MIFLSERGQEQAAKKTSRKTSGTRVRFGGISNFSNNCISANCLSVRTKNRAFSAKLKISEFVTAQEVPLPACRRLLFPLCNTKEIGDVYTQARSSRAAKEIGDVYTQAHRRKGVLSDTRHPKVRPLPFENALTWLASQADVLKGSSRVPGQPHERLLNRKINSCPIVRKYQLIVT